MASVDSLGIEGKQDQTCEHQYNKSRETDMDVCFCGHAMNPFRSSLGPPPFVSIHDFDDFVDRLTAMFDFQPNYCFFTIFAMRAIGAMNDVPPVF